MAYSSIGHMGYALVGLAAGTAEGVQGVIIYLAIYLAMTLGTFACILAMRRHGRMVEDIDQLAGLSNTSPMMAFLLAMLLFSLAGIPPLAGFFAKFYVFLAAINAGLYALAVIGVLLSVVGAYYYLRIVKIMYFDAPVERFEPMPGLLAAVLGASRPFHSVLFRLSGTAGERCRGRRQIPVLMPPFASSSPKASRWLPAASAGDGRLHQRRGAPPRRGGRAWASVDLVAASVGRTWPQRAAMAVPARQSLREPADRPQLPARDGGAARASCRRRRLRHRWQSFCLRRPARSFC